MKASFFEVTAAAAFLAFSRNPADALILEVGLGGRLDATNVVDRPLVTAIASLALDHQAYLGDTLQQIAAEKAGIAKRDVPLVTQSYPAEVAAPHRRRRERSRRAARSRAAQAGRSSPMPASFIIATRRVN